MKWLVACLALSCFAQFPLPELHTDAVDAGSVFRVKNNQSVPLVAYMIELVGYPGSFYTFIVDEVNGQSVKQGEERASRVQNMTVGAVPDYVKLTAALYADGSAAGDPAKSAALVERRKAMLEATRGVIQRIKAVDAMGQFGRVGLEKLAPRRGAVEQLLHLHRRSAAARNRSQFAGTPVQRKSARGTERA